MPAELSGDPDSSVEMPPADVLIIENEPDGVFLERYSRNGIFAGDAWHQTLAEAFSQADEEYQVERSAWREVPSGVDAVEYAVTAARSERS